MTCRPLETNKGPGSGSADPDPHTRMDLGNETARRKTASPDPRPAAALLQHATVLIAGGGTGGHITPALALYEVLRQRYPCAMPCLVGRSRSLEADLAHAAHAPFIALSAAPLKAGLLRRCLSALKMTWGVVQALILIRRAKPCAIVGFGGYTSFPLLCAGLLAGTVVVVHEANAIPGRAVRLLVHAGARLAFGIDTGHPRLVRLRACVANPRHVCRTGNPIRRECAGATAADGERITGLSHEHPTLLIVGGSQGSRRINTAILESIPALRQAVPRLQVIHLTGVADEQRVRAAHERAGVPHYTAAFSPDVPALYALAHLVIARAGALTIAEICAAGVPAILVPYPHATDQHQDENARLLCDAGGALLLSDREFTPQALTRCVADLLSDPDRMRRMADVNRSLACPRAADALCDFLEANLGGRA